MKLSFEFEPWELRLLGNLAKLDLMEDEEELDDDNDAEDEQRCCDDEPAEKTDDDKDEEERREAVAKLVSVLIGISHNGHDSDNADGCCCKR